MPKSERFPIAALMAGRERRVKFSETIDIVRDNGPGALHRAKDDNVVEAIAPDRADEPFRIAILRVEVRTQPIRPTSAQTEPGEM